MEEMKKVLDEQSSEGAPKKSNKKILYGVIAACIVLIIVAFALNGTFKSSNKETIVTNALWNLAKVPKDNSGTMELWKNLMEKGGSVEVSLKIEDMIKTSQSNPDLTGWGIRYKVESNQKEQKSSLNLALTNQNVDFLAADVYVDLLSKKIKAASPTLSSKSFFVDFQDGWEERLNNSYLAKEMQITPESIKAATDYMSQNIEFSEGVQKGELFNLTALKERFEKAVNVRKTFESEIQVTDLSSRSFSVNEKEVSCKGYQVVVPAETMLKIWGECKDFILKDEELAKSMKAYIELLVKYAMMEQNPDMEQFFGNMQGDLEEDLNKLTESLNKDLKDIQMDLYLNEENEIIFASVKMPESEDIEEQRMELLRKGGATLSENMTFSFIEEKDGAVAKSLIFDKTGKTENNVQDLSFTITLNDGTTSGDIANFTNSYKKEDGTFKTSLKIYSDVKQEAFDFQIEGSVSNKTKGEDFTCEIQKLALKIEGEPMVTLSGSYLLEAKDVTIVEPTGDEVDMFSATEEQWNEIIEETSSKVMGLYFSLYSMYGE